MRDVSLFYLKSYIGIHSKIQSKIIGQDIKKNTVKNYRTDIGTQKYRGVNQWRRRCDGQFVLGGGCEGQ